MAEGTSLNAPWESNAVLWLLWKLFYEGKIALSITNWAFVAVMIGISACVASGRLQEADQCTNRNPLVQEALSEPEVRRLLFFTPRENLFVLTLLWATQVFLYFPFPDADGVSVVWAGQIGQFAIALILMSKRLHERGSHNSIHSTNGYSSRSNGIHTREKRWLHAGMSVGTALVIYYAFTLAALTTCAHACAFVLGGLLMYAVSKLRTH